MMACRLEPRPETKTASLNFLGDIKGGRWVSLK